MIIARCQFIIFFIDAEFEFDQPGKRGAGRAFIIGPDLGGGEHGGKIISLDNFIRIFPNPVTNKLSIVSNYPHPLEIQLFDIAGHSFVKLTKASGTIEIDMSRFTAGSYLLVIKESKTLKSYRKIIIKQY